MSEFTKNKCGGEHISLQIGTNANAISSYLWNIRSDRQLNIDSSIYSTTSHFLENESISTIYPRCVIVDYYENLEVSSFNVNDFTKTEELVPELWNGSIQKSYIQQSYQNDRFIIIFFLLFLLLLYLLLLRLYHF
jgi:predicted glycosyltransferase involved in capsule biosynthesis